MARRSATAAAAAAFQQTLDSLDLPRSQLPDPEELGRRAALLAVADIAWKRVLGPLLDGKQAQELLGVRTRQALHDLVKRRRLLAVPWGEETRYPAFQFGPDGRPYPEMRLVLQAFENAKIDGLTLGSWFRHPQRALGGETPARWMAERHDPERLVTAAGRSAARLEH
ncbi:MAG TPA: hypothetical protein VGB52_13555 [Actinomycetota bacterium]